MADFNKKIRAGVLSRQNIHCCFSYYMVTDALIGIDKVQWPCSVGNDRHLTAVAVTIRSSKRCYLLD